MTTPILFTKSTKSVGIAIILTFLFGPLGLFYASVSGALIMIFTPIFLIIIAVVGFAIDIPVLIGWSFGLMLLFLLTYWLISMIWAVSSVISYNQEIEIEAKRQFDLWNKYHESNPNQFVVNINQKTSGLSTSGRETIEISTKPYLQDWLKNNPGKTINDYFTRFER